MFSMIHCGMIMVTTAVSTISSITTVGDPIPVSDQDPVVSDKERAVTGFGIEEEERNDPDYVLVRRHTPPFPVKDEVVLLAATPHDFQ